VRKIITALILAVTTLAGTADFAGATTASAGTARTYVYACGMGGR